MGQLGAEIFVFAMNNSLCADRTSMVDLFLSHPWLIKRANQTHGNRYYSVWHLFLLNILRTSDSAKEMLIGMEVLEHLRWSEVLHAMTQQERRSTVLIIDT